MRTIRTSGTGIGLMSWAFLALFNAGCQPGASQNDTPAPLPTLGVEAAGDASHPHAPAEGAEPTTSLLESLRQEAVKVEQTVDSGVKQTVSEVEQATLQPLPPPTAPAPEPTPAQPLPPPTPAAALEQGMQQVNGAVEQNIEQSANKLEKKVQKGFDRARDQIQDEVAPKQP